MPSNPCRAPLDVGGVSPFTVPTKAELAAIRKGEAQIARGETVPLTDLLPDLDRNPRKGSAKAVPRVSR